MQIASRGRRAIVGMAIGLTLLGMSGGPAFAHAKAAPTAAMTDPEYMSGTIGQCMRMMAMMTCDLPGMIHPDGPAAPIMQR